MCRYVLPAHRVRQETTAGDRREHTSIAVSVALVPLHNAPRALPCAFVGALVALAATGLAPIAAYAQAPVSVTPSVDAVPFWSQPDDELVRSRDRALYLKLDPQGCAAPATALLRISGPGVPTTDTRSGTACNFGDQPLRFRGPWTFGVSASSPFNRSDFSDLCPADNCSIVSVELDGEPKKTTKTTLKWSLSVNDVLAAAGSALFTRTVKKRGSKRSYVTTVKLR